MKILFLSQSSGSQNSVNDYMHDIVFHGLKKIYGDSIIDYPGVWYMYKDEVKKQNFSHLLNTSFGWDCPGFSF